MLFWNMICSTVGSKPISFFMAYTNETKTWMKSLSLWMRQQASMWTIMHLSPIKGIWLDRVRTQKIPQWQSCCPWLWSRNWWALVQYMFIQGNIYNRDIVKITESRLGFFYFFFLFLFYLLFIFHYFYF